MTYRRELNKLEDNALWRDAEKIAKAIFDTYDRLPEDEKMVVKWKLRDRAFDLTSDIAEACGTFIPKDIEYNLSQARRSVFSMKNAYRYLGRQGFLKIDPQLMVDMDKLVTDIDVQIKKSWHDIDEIETDRRDTKPAPSEKGPES